MYKSSRTTIFQDFFKTDFRKIKDGQNHFYLVLFFSKNNCEPCLDVINVLNRLTEPFSVIGFVPEKELEDEEELRNKTNANFKLRGLKRYKKFIPPYAPTLFGVSQNNEIFFILPSVPNETNYLEQFLADFHHKAYPLLVKK
jgi:hypothetical protein